MSETRDERSIAEAGQCWMRAQSTLRDVKAAYSALDQVDQIACEVLAQTNPAGVIERHGNLVDAIAAAKDAVDAL